MSTVSIDLMRKDSSSKKLSWVARYFGPIPVFFLAILAAVLDFSLPAHPATFEAFMLLPILNTIFLFLASCLVCYIAMRSYLISGSFAVLSLGCGVLALGMGTLMAGWLFGYAGSNVNVILFNVSALMASIFHIANVVIHPKRTPVEPDMTYMRRNLIIGYGSVFVFEILLALAALKGMMPTFFTEASGPTVLRQIIVLTAAILFSVSALYNKMKRFAQTGTQFFYWYSWALALLAVSVFSAFQQRAVCDPLGWTSRTAMYFAGIYFVLAVLSALREARARGVSLNEAFSELFQESRLYLQDVLATVSDAIVSCDKNGQILQWNHAAEKIFGYSQTEIIGKKIDLILYDKDILDLENFAVTDIELKKKNGDFFNGEVAITKRTLSSMQISTFLIRDITERKRAAEMMQRHQDELEQKVAKRTADLRRLNQILKMISRCNQALVQITNEQQLIRTICRIIYDEGNYRMVWAGFAEDDAAKTVRPIASAGFEEGYLEKAQITWDGDQERGQGPTGTAIRTGQICIGKNFLTDSELTPWRERALQCGYRSSIALPLSTDGRTFGALTLYAEQPMAFTPSQTELLRELADNLAFGIMALRSRSERDETMKALEQRTVQLRNLALEMTRIEDRERHRLAQILHDHLQQLLAAASFNLVSLRSYVKCKEGNHTIQKVDEILKESFEATRSLTTELSPQVLTRAGLAAALHWLAKWYKQKHGLEIDVKADEVFSFESDEVRIILYQSVRELLFNVVKHAKVKEAQVEMFCEENNLRITISDQGAGFDLSKLQAHRPLAGGFGLFNLRHRLELVNGNLKIESSSGYGSRFTLTVPIKNPSELPANVEIGAPKNLETPSKLSLEKRPLWDKNRKIKILIVDDHAVVREGLINVLKNEDDFTIAGEAGDGLKAIKLAQRLRPDVILMDVSMPHLNGLDATSRIFEEQPQCRIIGLSAFEDEEQGAAIRAAGAVAYFNKSVSPKKLIHAIRACMKSSLQEPILSNREEALRRKID